MTIPAYYTYETFADYLKNEVLLDTAIELGWLDIYSSEPPAPHSQYDQIETLTHLDRYTNAGWGEYSDVYMKLFYGEGFVTWNDGNDGTLDLTAPSKYAIPAGTKIVEGNIPLSTGVVHTVTSDVAINDIVINVTSTGSPSGSNGITGWFYRGEVPVVMPDRIIHPVYEKITDSTLMEIGETSIEGITDLDGKRELRLYGRRESWRFAMQALASDYDYSSDVNGLGRYSIYQHCQEMFELESGRIGQIYSGGSFQNDVLTSQPVKIKVRW